MGKPTHTLGAVAVEVLSFVAKFWSVVKLANAIDLAAREVLLHLHAFYNLKLDVNFIEVFAWLVTALDPGFQLSRHVIHQRTVLVIDIDTSCCVSQLESFSFVVEIVHSAHLDHADLRLLGLDILKQVLGELLAPFSFQSLHLLLADLNLGAAES